MGKRWTGRVTHPRVDRSKPWTLVQGEGVSDLKHSAFLRLVATLQAEGCPTTWAGVLQESGLVPCIGKHQTTTCPHLPGWKFVVIRISQNAVRLRCYVNEAAQKVVVESHFKTDHPKATSKDKAYAPKFGWLNRSLA